MFTPMNSFFTFGVLMSVPILVKTLKKCDRESAHSWIHRYTH